MAATPRQLTKRAFAVAGALLAVSIAINLPEPDSVPALAKPPAVKVAPTSSTMASFEAQPLSAVGGSTTVPGVGLKGGSSTIRGKVTINGAAASGATVRIDRFVGDKSAGADLKTNEAGEYSLGGIPGGRYRVRAFRKPDATLTTPQVIFLSAGESRSLDIPLSRYNSGFVVSSAIAPNPPRVGETANIAVSITNQGVDDSGVARSSGQNGVTLTLITQSGRTIISANPTTTSGRGVATWTIRCEGLGDQGLSIGLPDGSTAPVNVAACQLPPPTTTSTVVTDGTEDKSDDDANAKSSTGSPSQTAPGREKKN